MSWTLPGWARGLWGGGTEGAGEESTDYLWDPSDSRSFETLRRSDCGGAAIDRPAPSRRPAAAARAPVVGGSSAAALEELPAAEEPRATPWLRRRPAVLTASFLVASVLALVIATAIGALGSGPSETELEPVFDSGFADGEAEARAGVEEPDGSPSTEEQTPVQATPVEEEASAQAGAAEPSEPAAEGQAAAAEQAAAPSVYVELLDLIPDNSNARDSVILIDYLRVRASQGIESIPDVPNSAEVRDSFADLFEFLTSVSLWGYGPTFVSGGSADGIGESAILPYNVGYSVADVDQDVRAGLPPEQYTAARGRFDPERTEQAIRRCGDCPAAATGEYRGVSYYAWGEDFADGDPELGNAPPAFDSLGRGGRLAVLESYVFRTLWTDGLEAMVDASRGGRSLATNPDFRAAAEALDDLGNYTVWLSTRTQSVDQLRDAYLDSHLGAGFDVAEFAWPPGPGVPVLQRYAVLGLGLGFDRDGPFLTIVLVHDTEAQARDNVRLLQRRVAEEDSLFFSRRFLVSNDPQSPVRHGPAWADLIEQIDARAEGRLVIAKLRVTRRVPSADLFFVQYGPLLLHN